MAISAACSMAALVATISFWRAVGKSVASGGGVSAATRPPAAMEHATPTSPWQPTSAPEMEAFSLYRMPIAAAVRK